MISIVKKLLIGFIGTVLFCFGAFIVISNHTDGSWRKTSGTIVGSRAVAGASSPIVEYEAVGTKFQVPSSDQPLFRKYKTGDKLQVAYNPNSPGQAQIVDSEFYAILPWIFVTLGAGMIVAVVVMYRRSLDKEYDEVEESEVTNDLDKTVY